MCGLALEGPDLSVGLNICIPGSDESLACRDQSSRDRRGTHFSERLLSLRLGKVHPLLFRNSARHF